MRHSDIFTPKIPQNEFLRMHGPASRKVVCYIREMEKETDRIDKNNRANE
jgi:hypothetical protein